MNLIQILSLRLGPLDVLIDHGEQTLHLQSTQIVTVAEEVKNSELDLLVHKSLTLQGTNSTIQSLHHPLFRNQCLASSFSHVLSIFDLQTLLHQSSEFEQDRSYYPPHFFGLFNRINPDFSNQLAENGPDDRRCLRCVHIFQEVPVPCVLDHVSSQEQGLLLVFHGKRVPEEDISDLSDGVFFLLRAGEVFCDVIVVYLA